MSVSKIVTSTVLALSLVAVPTIASAAPAASKLSLSAPTSAVASRTGASVRRTSKGGGSSIIIAVLAAAAVIAGIVIAADGGKKTSN